MDSVGSSVLPRILENSQAEILAAWPYAQGGRGGRAGGAADVQRREQATELLRAIASAARTGNVSDVQASEWAPVREALGGISRRGVQQGRSPSDTATAVLSLKKPIFELVRKETGADPDALAREMWASTHLIDALALHTTEVFQQAREQVVLRQQEDLLELSTPVIKLWDGILALPMIGTLDSARTQTVMESLLQKIVEIEAEVAIIDITGVPTVDTLTAQHLLKTVTAARLMGVDCIISGIRPQIAQTIVQLGVDLSGVITKATLADAFALALRQRGLGVSAATAAATTTTRL